MPTLPGISYKIICDLRNFLLKHKMTENGQTASHLVKLFSLKYFNLFVLSCATKSKLMMATISVPTVSSSTSSHLLIYIIPATILTTQPSTIAVIQLFLLSLMMMMMVMMATMIRCCYRVSFRFMSFVVGIRKFSEPHYFIARVILLKW